MASIPFAPPSGTTRSHRAPLTGSRRIILYSSIGFFLFLIWSMIAHVDEATHGQGKVIPSSKVQLIQSSEPATVREILVRSGERVRQGQLLVRLDDTQSSSELGQIEAETQALQQRASRLGEEGGVGSTTVTGDEGALLAARRSALSGRLGALNATAEQRRREAAEAAATINSLSRSLQLANENVNRLAPLAAKNIVPQTELATAQREVVDLQGRIAAAREQQGRAMAAVSEARAQAAEASAQFRQDALNERSQVTQKIAINEQTLRGAQGRLSKTELRSPVDGVVNDVQATTRGGFVQAGQKIMEVVPLGDKLLVETRVKPSDIAFIKVGDRALVKVTAYDFSIYGGLEGKVVQISADSIYDEATREAYFNVIVETERSYLTMAGRRLPITPGMMTDTQIITGRKSILTYLLKPVLKAKSDALTER
ncbi:HlyD family type I secretion periplasmic adaptor subunit [Sphingomonas astaxanthinifaciens]|uniref:Membrane fusion protein (MFP) family protein n=1 Tax=Sphingomonas astaxanthinifaciens DSM 22298 TaxID=1123267 RepID=A0ABQ5Z756_9SPHN|nr:HlyD family type I secretion periplasmic adaptor subunit [Sphingomonas astaxanthinifaciens]GLR48625.1 HlyD family type I secretion periplasmic adaptor subunit [Sphingomonas astaxanthinifaciens DSM 22298]